MARKYRLKKRAQRQAQTRQRIVEAAVELHTTLGPAHTTVLAIAQQAGVERPTFYRHFPTMKDLFGACSAHYSAQNRLPNPEPWLKIKDLEARLRQGLIELYGYYSLHEHGLWNILRDLEDMPELRPFAARRIAHLQCMRDVLVDGWPGHNKRQKRFVAAVGHALDFFAWRSLRRQGLTNEEAAELSVDFVRSKNR
jgi:AcrR family transcriptional regulator